MPAAGILGWKRSKYQRPILHNSKSPETPRKLFLEIIKNIERKKYARGGPTWPRGWGARPTPRARPLPRGPPVGSPVAIFCCMRSFVEEKNHKQPFGTRLRRHQAEPWRNQSRAPAELFCRGNSLREGEIITFVITNAPLIGRGQSPSTSSPAPSHLQTVVHILYPILVSKSGIGASRLLIVLITPCS